MSGYRVWECQICGWLYDEAEGWPEDGIAPGTRWEDIPDDWCCPECGATKDEFDMQPLAEAEAPAAPESAAASAPAPATLTEAVVIIGSGLAGYNLAKEFRKLDSATPLVMVTADSGAFYSKPQLSAALAQGKTPQELARASAEEMARELKADILVHTRVQAIDTGSKTLSLESGDHRAELPYGRLVLATGAACRPLPAIEGNGRARVFRINSLDDYHRFRTALAGQSRQRVLLLGAGLIGCEFANDLCQSGYQVDMVDPLDWPLASLLPEAAGRDLQGALETAGVRFHGNARVTHLDRSDSSGSGGITAQLDSGETLHADIALAALGLRANTALAESAGLRIGRGIAVDRQLRSSDPHIFALGDCAEVDGQLLHFVAPLMACARALACTLSGSPTPVHYGAIPVAVKTTVRPTSVCPPRPGAEGRWHTESTPAGVRAEFRDDGGRLLGFALTGAATAERETLAAECVPLMEG